MNLRSKNVFTLFFRSSFGLPLGTWIVVSIVYYWWLISRINVLETQNKVFKSQLKLSQNAMRQIESDSTYKVPEIPDEAGTLCETVHIALVCMGKCTRIIMPMLKSLLQHRQNPIHFHFIVDTAADQTISKLFDTWDLPDVKYTCYNAQNSLSQVRWVPNSHYSGIYALVKLLFPDILPDTLQQVIVLDSDLTFLCDIAELWNMFRNMTDNQLFGLVENESNWYYDTAKRWPALGRGYNTGVMLLDLNKIRKKINWTKVWHSAVNENIERLKQTTLADQDVINAIIKKDPNLVYNISCQYNVQMSTKTLAKGCYGEDRDNIKIIHWNSPSKYNIRIRDADYFKNIYLSYVNFDGNLLKEKLHTCSQTEPVTYKINHSDLCSSFRAAQRVKLRTHLYYMEYTYDDIDNFDVTLVLQLSMDRLQFLERLVKYWEGPLSAAIYLSDCEVTKFESFIRDWSDTLSSRKNIGYHLVFKHDDCLVVAAFETQRYRASPPRSKAALRARLANDVAPFRAREWPRGHRATNYTKWINANAPYNVSLKLTKPLF
ncbi:Glycosyltransferase-like protein LARGE1 [Papilio machaon]|uniref:Glycosyltransferase-like protein LARGE1 n=1 Tax=Papilio machaon TaxID=76193 RepID=A0A0N0PE39_PAPMA|nr:Glycosyltransferase-like protein LARGE1 [Papilio machaon]